jgi:NADH:ubiquinone oxidoreductase subunit 3 (subunit A)
MEAFRRVIRQRLAPPGACGIIARVRRPDTTQGGCVADNWGFVALFTLIAVSVPLLAMGMAWLFRPHRPGAVKSATYECGLQTVGETWIQFKVQYYLYALIFVLFDVETIFLYPWAVAYNQLPLLALFEMLVFIAILAVGLVYAWRKGALEWV